MSVSVLHPISREEIERVYDRKKYEELLRIEQHGTPERIVAHRLRVLKGPAANDQKRTQ